MCARRFVVCAAVFMEWFYALELDFRRHAGLSVLTRRGNSVRHCGRRRPATARAVLTTRGIDAHSKFSSSSCSDHHSRTMCFSMLHSDAEETHDVGALGTVLHRRHGTHKVTLLLVPIYSLRRNPFFSQRECRPLGRVYVSLFMNSDQTSPEKIEPFDSGI